MMPGTRLMHFARRWFPPSTVASVFEPLVADWQRQWSDAAPAERHRVNVKGCAAFVATTAIMLPRATLASASFRARPLVLAGGFWLATSALQTLPYVREDLPLKFLWLLLPASLTLMLPFAILPAIDALRQDGDEPTPSHRRAALVLVVVAVIGVAIGHGWITPAANQRWRNAVMSELNGRPSVAFRGLREMTTGELIAGKATTIPALSGTPRARELSMRLTLALLPAVLAWLRWRSLSRVRKRSWPMVKSCLVAIAALAAYFAVMAAGAAVERRFLAPGFGPVLALGLFAVTTRTGIWLRQRAVQKPFELLNS